MVYFPCFLLMIMKPITSINYRLILGGTLALFVCGQTGWVGSLSGTKLSPQASVRLDRELKQQRLNPDEELVSFLQQAEGGNGARLRKIVAAFVGSRRIQEIERILSEKDPGVRPSDAREFFDHFNEKRLRKGLNDALERTRSSGFIKDRIFAVKKKRFQNSLEQLIQEVKRLHAQEVRQTLHAAADDSSGDVLKSIERVLTRLYSNESGLLEPERELLDQFFTQYRQLLKEAKEGVPQEEIEKRGANLQTKLTALEQSVQWKRRQGQQETIRRAVLSKLATLEGMLSQRSRERLEVDFREYQELTQASPREVVSRLGDPNPLFEEAFEEKNRVERLLAQASSEDSFVQSERLLDEANQELAVTIRNISTFRERFANAIEGAKRARIRDAYDTLGLVEGTPPETVKKEFRRQALQVHPDKVRARLFNRGIPADGIERHSEYLEAVSRTAVLTEAYAVLSSQGNSNRPKIDETTISAAL